MHELRPVGDAIIERLDIAGRRRRTRDAIPEQYWEMISEHVSLAVAALHQVDEVARGRIRAHAIAHVSAYEKDGKVRVPGVARCIVGTKQDASGTHARGGVSTSCRLVLTR